MSLRVDVATGATVLRAEDLRLPGFLPLVLARAYRSDRRASGLFGYGWHSGLDVSLTVGRDDLVVRRASGDAVAFAPVEAGVQATHHETGLVLQHHSNAYVVYASPLVRLVFPKGPARGGRLWLGQVEDAGGNAIRFTYAGGRLVRLTDTVGRQVQFTYAGDRVAAVQLAEAGGATPVRAYAYDAAGDLVAVRDATGREVRYAYQDHLMVAVRGRTGDITYAQYVVVRRCLARWSGDGAEVHRFAYDPPSATTLVQATDGRQTLYRHEGPRTALRIGPEGEAQAFYYDERHRLMGITDADGDVAVLERYAPEERTLTLVAGTERVWQGQADERGLVQEVTVGSFGPFGVGYREDGHLTSLTMPAGGRWSFDRDRQGAVVQIKSPAGRWARISYEASGRAVAVADALGTRLTEKTDAAGRLVERTDALGRRERRQYDADGRLVTVALEGGYQVRFAYDAAGTVVGASDTEGLRLETRREAAGQPHSNGPAAASAREGADAPLLGLCGEVRQVGPEDDPVSFAYDAGGVLTAVESGAGRLAFDLDADGLPSAVELEPGRRWSFQRDARGRPVEIIADEATRCHLSYDAADRLLAAEVEGAAPVALAYDALDRLTEVRLGEERRRFGGGHDGALAHPLFARGLRLLLMLGRQGLGVAMVAGRVHLPLWTQAARPHRPWPALPAPLPDVRRAGIEAALCAPAPSDPRRVLDAWGLADGRRWHLSELPSAEDTGLPLPLGGWFLQRQLVDVAHPDERPLAVPAHDAQRAGEPAVTGTHLAGTLRPLAFPLQARPGLSNAVSPRSTASPLKAQAS